MIKEKPPVTLAVRALRAAKVRSTKHSGYLVGGTSPFGTRKSMLVYMEETILELSKVYINGGKQGYLVSLNPKEIECILKPRLVRVGFKK